MAVQNVLSLSVGNKVPGLVTSPKLCSNMFLISIPSSKKKQCLTHYFFSGNDFVTLNDRSLRYLLPTIHWQHGQLHISKRSGEPKLLSHMFYSYILLLHLHLHTCENELKLASKIQVLGTWIIPNNLLSHMIKLYIFNMNVFKAVKHFEMPAKSIIRQ